MKLVTVILSLLISSVAFSGVPRFIVKPYLQFAIQTGITILWETSEPGRSWVEYGAALYNAAAPNLSRRAMEISNTSMHTVVLDSLQADWDRDPYGNVIHLDNGRPNKSLYKTRIGYSDPNWVAGLINRLRYKQFMVAFSFDGRFGGLMYEYMNDKMWDTGSHPDSDNQYRYEETVNKNQTFIGDGVKVVSGTATYDNYGRIIKDTRVFAKNDKVVSYETYARSFKGGSPAGNLDPTFVKLREVTLEYMVPGNITHKIGAANASIALTAQNVWMWRKQFRFADPDNGTDNLNSPTNRYIGANIKLTF